MLLLLTFHLLHTDMYYEENQSFRKISPEPIKNKSPLFNFIIYKYYQ